MQGEIKISNAEFAQNKENGKFNSFKKSSKSIFSTEIAERGSALNDFVNQFWFESLLHGNFVEKWWK